MRRLPNELPESGPAGVFDLIVEFRVDFYIATSLVEIKLIKIV